jgi:hypothetical protein
MVCAEHYAKLEATVGAGKCSHENKTATCDRDGNDYEHCDDCGVSISELCEGPSPLASLEDSEDPKILYMIDGIRTRDIGSPASDFSRFEDLVVTAVEGTEHEKEDALEELAEDLANVEALAQVAYLLTTEGERREHYDAVWGHKEKL